MKTTRVLLLDTNKEIPVVLNDPFLEGAVKFEPDAIVSEEYAKLLVNDFPFLYKRIDNKYEVDKSVYRYRSDFKVKEFTTSFAKLTPEEKTHVCEYIDEMISERNKPIEEVKDAKTDNSGTE
jgi:hypothetical protein